MARSRAYWKGVVLNAVGAEIDLSAVDSSSAVAEWNLWADMVAFAMVVLENLFDFFTADVLAIIAAQKPHTLQWYATKAKQFQYGVILPADTDVYAVVPPVDTGVLVVKYAAAVEYVNVLRIKVAKASGDVLAPLSDPELTAFTAYMNRIKDAGVRLLLTSGAADDLKLVSQLYYDPLILDADGKRLDGTNDTPVQDAIELFLTGLPFNGVFVVNSLIAAVQAVEGVKIYYPLATANYAATDYVDVPVEYVPDAGYLALNVGYFIANVTYIPH